ncbi:MAG: hypothetical protein GYA14_07805 [Ignavibacteria bacterium]|nr:hypothetical protein [Ignavibacteria bacterium]
MTLHYYLALIAMILTFIVAHIRMAQIYKESKEYCIKLKDHNSFYSVVSTLGMFYTILLITLIMYLLGFEV